MADTLTDNGELRLKLAEDRRTDRPELTWIEEHRQVAKTYLVPSHLVALLDWNKVAAIARQLGADFDVASDGTGDAVVTLFWRYDRGEITALPHGNRGQ